MNLRISSLFALVSLIAVAACAAPATAPQGGSKDPAKDKAGDTKNSDKDDKGTTNTDGKSASDEKPATEPGDTEEKDYLWPPVINSGFTGGAGQTFKVPLETDITGTLTWAAADPSIVEIVSIPAPAGYEEAKKEDPKIPQNLSFAMLTTKKAGTTKISVTNGTKKAESDVTVKPYTSAAFTIGQTRYKTGAGTAERQPCAGCHEKPDGADHSPSWLALFEDDDVLGAIQTSTYAKDDEKYQLNKGNHKWNLTEEEKAGIMTYLRGLAPRGF